IFIIPMSRARDLLSWTIFSHHVESFSALGFVKWKGFVTGQTVAYGLDHLQHRKRIDRMTITRTCEDRSRTVHVL
ncbi:hypothetical protein AVEN_231176-1, partial [Araneus ventricosus]